MATLLLVAGGRVVAGPPPATPLLSVSAPASVRAGEARDFAVTISNAGPGPFVVLPNAVRLRIEGAGAQYVPYPGPPLDPWEGARELAPRERMIVPFPDTSDRRGVWKLPPGDYRIVAMYDVPQDLRPPPGQANAGLVWRGRIESAPAKVTVLPQR